MIERSLIDKIRKGDRKAFDTFCSKLYAGLVSYARMFLSPDWADDVVQDVLFTIWQKRAFLGDEFSPEKYLYRSVHNRALNFIKQQQHSDDFRDWNKDRILALTSSSTDVEKNSALQRLYDGDLRKRLNEAIAQLPPRQQEIFRLSYIEELTSKEISVQLGISSRTVEAHLYEALKGLRLSLSTEALVLLGVFIIWCSEHPPQNWLF